jgi:DNA-binding XRE family transcriptional regulator
VKKSPFADNPTINLLGRIALLEEMVKTLVERANENDSRCHRIESKLERVVSRSQLVTEKQAAELLDVSVQAMMRWRKEKPAPRIPFVRTEGGQIRYRVEAIETYLNSRERGRYGALRAA